MTALKVKHPNEESHAKVMRALKAMTTEELVQTLVDAGILTKSGKIAKLYR